MLTRPNYVARWRLRYKLGIFIALYASTIAGLRAWNPYGHLYEGQPVTEKAEPVIREGCGAGSHAPIIFDLYMFDTTGPSL